MLEPIAGGLQSKRLVRQLHARRDEGAVMVPAALTIAEGYAVQEAVFALGGHPLAAWKIALTNSRVQYAMGIESPAAGRLSANAVMRSGTEIPAPLGELYVEAELVVELNTDLPPAEAPFELERIVAAIGPVHAGIEVVSTRFASSDLPVGALIADNCMADRLVVGDRLAEQWQSRFEDMPVTLDVGSHTTVTGSTSAVLGNPLHALAWLADWSCQQGVGLKRGQLISCGTCTGITEAKPGDTVAVDFAGLGRAAVRFSI